MEEKIIGILGGMGPEATADLFYKIIKATNAKKDQEHLRIIIDNNPKIPDRTAAILGKGENPLPLLQKTAHNLEKAGADFLVIPCNTAHYFIPAIEKSIRIPVLNMIEETLKDIKEKLPDIKKIGLLATMGIYKTGLYDQYFNKYNIAGISPEEKAIAKIMEVIYAVKADKLSRDIKESMLKIAGDLINNGAEAIIAGCTEIPLILKQKDIPVPLIDPTNILAKAAVKKAR
jgi:aspartate racemase